LWLCIVCGVLLLNAQSSFADAYMPPSSCNWDYGSFETVRAHPRDAPLLLNVSSSSYGQPCETPLHLVEVEVKSSEGTAVPGTLRYSSDPKFLMWVPQRTLAPSALYSVKIVLQPMVQYHSPSTYLFNLETTAYVLPTSLDIPVFEAQIDSQLDELHDCCDRPKCSSEGCTLCWLESRRQHHRLNLRWRVGADQEALLPYFDSYLLIAGGAELISFVHIEEGQFSTEFYDAPSPVCVSVQLKHPVDNSELAVRTECFDVPPAPEEPLPSVDFGACVDPWLYNDHPLRANEPYEAGKSADEGCALSTWRRSPSPLGVCCLGALLLLGLWLRARRPSEHP
jgi:hypothetical protein